MGVEDIRANSMGPRVMHHHNVCGQHRGRSKRGRVRGRSNGTGSSQPSQCSATICPKIVSKKKKKKNFFFLVFCFCNADKHNGEEDGEDRCHSGSTN